MPFSLKMAAIHEGRGGNREKAFAQPQQNEAKDERKNRTGVESRSIDLTSATESSLPLPCSCLENPSTAAFSHLNISKILTRFPRRNGFFFTFSIFEISNYFKFATALAILKVPVCCFFFASVNLSPVEDLTFSCGNY